jgi:hypothetical protein
VAQYRIGKARESCSSCGKEFQDGEEVVSCVFPEGDLLGRADLCLACWDAGKAPPSISSWRRKVEKKAPPKRFDRKAALELFQALADSEEPGDADTAYILALLLMRKNVFELARTGSENGVGVMMLKLRGGTEEFRVPSRDLSEEQLEKVKDNLEAIFEGGQSAD